MAVSEYLGNVCPVCRVTWKSTQDFERLEVYDAPFFPPEAPIIFEPATFWKMRCRSCGSVSIFIHEVR